MPGFARMRMNLRSAAALGIGLAVACLSAAPALAVTPSPPAGAPAVESAPSSLVGLDPELPASVVSASAASGSHWTPEQAIYGTASTNDIAIKGAGGTTIRVDEIYPTTASGAPAKGPFPVLLTMTPYGKGQGGSSSPGSAASPGGESATGGADDYLAERGYIEIVEDVRGTGDSNGSWGLFDPVQQRDAIKVVNWAAHLPHSDGRVGTYGPSYLGIDQLLLAGAVGRNSPLKAIFPMVSANDIYRDTSFMGGLLDFEFSETYLGLTAGLNTTNPITDTASDPELLSDLGGIESDHANGLATYHAAQTEEILTGGAEAYDGSYWHARSPQNILARVVANHIPAYLVGGEFDIFQNGEPVNYAELQNAWDGRSATAPMASGQRTTGRYQLIDGPWEHLNGSSVDVDPARARMVRHLAQARADRHGEDRDAAPLLRPRQRSVRRDLDLPVHGRHAEASVLRRRRDTHDLGAVSRRAVADRAGWDARRLGAFTGQRGARDGHGLGAITGQRRARNGDRLGAVPDCDQQRHASVEPDRSSLRTPDRPVVDGRHLGTVGHRRAARAVRQRRSGVAGRAVGHQLHLGSAVSCRDGGRPDHRHRVRELDHAPRRSSSPSSRTSLRAAAPTRSPRVRSSVRSEPWTLAGRGRRAA